MRELPVTHPVLPGPPPSLRRSGRAILAFMDVPEEYVSNGRTYQLRQEADNEWAIREDREHHGTLTRTDKGWLAAAPGDEAGDDDRTETWQATLDSFLDYLR